MDVEEFFAPAIELSLLLNEHKCATPQDRPAIAERIYKCQYLVHLRQLQSHTNVEAVKGSAPNNPIINASKRSFFVSSAVPRLAANDTDAPISMPYHRHDYVEIIVVLRGAYIQVINGCEYRHSVGDVCVLTPNVTHRDFIPNSDERVLYLGLSKSLLHGELAEFLDRYPHLRNLMRYQGGASEQKFILFHTDNTALLATLCMQIAQEDKEKLAGHHLIINGLLVRLFDLLLQNHKQEVIRQTAQEIEKTLIAEMLDYIKRNIAAVSREEMAQFFHFNPDYLNRMLLRATGLTYSQNVREIRLQLAESLLVESRLSVNAIIREVGFSNKSYFNQIFSQRYGVLPGKYRIS